MRARSGDQAVSLASSLVVGSRTATWKRRLFRSPLRGGVRGPASALIVLLSSGLRGPGDVDLAAAPAVAATGVVCPS